MTTPYRSETEALRERRAALHEETKRLEERRAELDWVRTREAELKKELAAIDEKLAGASRRRLPTLDQVSVASPCNASWSEMLGDERVRFCLSCEKHVYNISAMPQAEAEALISAQADGELCVRFYRRADGTIMTADCPVGVTRKRRKKLALGVAGAGALAFGAFAAYERTTAVTMGKMEASRPSPPVEPLAAPPAMTTEEGPAPDLVAPPRVQEGFVAGRMRIDPPAPAGSSKPKVTKVTR